MTLPTNALLAVLLLAANAPTPADTAPRSPFKYFSQAKGAMYQVYADHRTTLYCGCVFTRDRRVDQASCGYTPRKNTERAARTEAEHVVPAAAFGRHRTCWQKPICRGKNGKSFKGRECCEEVDAEFRAAYHDLHNLFPSVGEVNGDRGDYRFGIIPGEAREYGACDFEVDHRARVAEPAPNIRGDIARTWFYMEQRHGVRIREEDRAILNRWMQEDPVDEWESERDRRIARIQGNHNPLVQGR